MEWKNENRLVQGIGMASSVGVFNSFLGVGY